MAVELPLERLEEALAAVLDAQNPVALLCYTPFGVVRGILERRTFPGRDDPSRDHTGETDLVIGLRDAVIEHYWNHLPTGRYSVLHISLNQISGFAVLPEWRPSISE